MENGFILCFPLRSCFGFSQLARPGKRGYGVRDLAPFQVRGTANEDPGQAASCWRIQFGSE
jgi:hypothetical protein